MDFRAYQHVERLGKDEVEGILENENVYVQAKLDGTQSSIWIDKSDFLCAGSRKRELHRDEDNAGFWNWLYTDMGEAEAIERYLRKHIGYTLFGEFLGTTKFIGHIKDYNKDALNTFWIFDVMDSEGNYIPYGEYIDGLREFGLDKYHVPILAYLDYPTVDEIAEIAKNNNFLLEHTNHAGEGVVIKVYNYKNKYGNVKWGKLVLDEFIQNKKKKKHTASIEDAELYIIENYVTDAEISKAYAKTAIQFDEEFNNKSGKHIGFYLNCLWDGAVIDELPHILKKMKNPTIDFKRLRSMCDNAAKQYANIG